METVQLQCGHCQKLMAVGVAHLGKQVQCPHCHQVVQVPQASTMSEAPPRAEENLPKLRISTHDDESILASNSDDLFADRPPRLELPPANEPNVAVREKEQAGKTDAALPGTEDNEELPLPTIPRRREEKSMVVPIMFMFLIPYALATTAFIAFLLYNQGRNRFDPLERLPDPKPNEGGPRQIQHDLDVKLKTSLQQTVRIGDLEVTPLKVQQTSEGDLTLHMKMRNASSNLEFNPMLDDFCKVRESLSVGKPYTFLEPPTGKASDRLYGGYLYWQVGKKEVDHYHRIKPGQEMLIQLTTRDLDRSRAKRLLEKDQDVLWRIQVRRGFLPTSQGPKSATAVIGVEFNTGAIEKEV